MMHGGSRSAAGDKVVQGDARGAQMTADGSAEQPVEDVLIEARGSLAVITLNRPRALNALTTAMREKLAAAFPRFAREAHTYCVVIQSASTR
jgi:1,4-dihydroxy-2-naphthoyl-CoA synthase